MDLIKARESKQDPFSSMILPVVLSSTLYYLSQNPAPGIRPSFNKKGTKRKALAEILYLAFCWLPSRTF